jgi:cytoskeletal protein RodZ
MQFMAVTEPPGDFDYLWEALGDTDDVGRTGTDRGLDDDDFGFDDGYRDDRYDRERPRPWYRTTAAVVAIGAIGIAGVAILVSAVLLMSRNSGGPVNPAETTTPTASTPSSAVPATTPPPVEVVPPSPTDSPSPTASSTASAPPVVEAPRRTEPTKSPEIGVTRTPVTRYPISVSPPVVPHF